VLDTGLIGDICFHAELIAYCCLPHSRRSTERGETAGAMRCVCLCVGFMFHSIFPVSIPLQCTYTPPHACTPLSSHLRMHYCCPAPIADMQHTYSCSFMSHAYTLQLITRLFFTLLCEERLLTPHVLLRVRLAVWHCIDIA